MSIYIRLDKPINTNQMLRKIEHEINKHRQSNSLEDSILCIEIKPVVHVVDGLARIGVKEYLEDKDD